MGMSPSARQWLLGDLQLFIRGELRFATDAQGRPCGTADIHTSGDQFWMKCDTCSAGFGVQGWHNDGSGEVILTDQETNVEDSEDSQVEMEPETPPPGT